MDSITLQNYRCFGSEEQTARLAPLTLLVGPNSTGKTSFLALIRALWDVAFREVVPNFREEPYDLGSWDDIVHQPGGRAKPADQFKAGFEFVRSNRRRPRARGVFSFSSTFANYSEGTFPTGRRFSDDNITLMIDSGPNSSDAKVKYRIKQGGWKENPGVADRFLRDGNLFPLNAVPYRWREIESEDLALLDQLRRRVRLHGIPSVGRRRPLSDRSRPFSSAPVRSRPRRTYDPMLLSSDAEGDYIPSYLAGLYRRDTNEWRLVKCRLEKFGRASGLFDEISVRSPLGKSDGDPFQIQVRKFGKRRKGPQRNLIDVGYGISQVLPVLTELMRSDAPGTFLLQQPEVHLHPSAQAALGTLFCQTAAAGRQLVIETHSDYIIDRVRMDVRDGTTDLKPEDVSILYFEPGDLNVKIHSIRIDAAGNVLDAPRSYSNFFMDEVSRSIGLRKG